MLTLVIFGGAGILFLAMSLKTLFHLRWMRRLPSRKALAATQPVQEERRISCSAVIAARDEQTRIEETIRHLLAQQDVGIEIIVVDDRSIDQTGDIVRRLAKEDPRVHLRRVDTLPEGWLGKSHACHIGAG